MKCSEVPCNKVSNKIRRYIDRMKFAVHMAFSFTIFFHVLLLPFFIIVCMDVRFVCFCLILYIMYFYCYVDVFLLLCTFCSVYPVFQLAPSATLTEVFPCFFSPS